MEAEGSSPRVGERHLGLETLGVYPLPQGCSLVVSSGSVVDFEGDAIVNAANSGCQGGGGVDGAINQAGGAALRDARRDLPCVEGSPYERCKTGDAVITIGGNLQASWVIHAVGPMYSDCASLEEGDALVTSAYKASLAKAKEKELSTVAFSLISASIFRGRQTLEKVLEAGVQGIKQGEYQGLKEVHMVGFTANECEALKTVCNTLFNADPGPSASTENTDDGDFVDISPPGDRGILKKILVEGSGTETPPPGNMVSVHYVGTLHSDGSKFDSSRDRPGVFEFQVGVGQVIKGWDVGICSMKKGEKAILRCTSDYAYGDSGSPPKIPGGATLNFEVELFSWKEKQKDPYEMTISERSEYALKQKDAGNAAVKSQNWPDAVDAYEDGIRYITYEGGSDDEDEPGNSVKGGSDLVEDDKKLAIALLTNCAMANLKLDDASSAIRHCDKALHFDAGHVKALFRRGSARLQLKEYAEATADFQRVLEIDKDNKEAAVFLQKCSAEEKKEKQKEKAMYGKMFG